MALILFDKDDTLVRTEEACVEAMFDVLVHFGQRGRLKWPAPTIKTLQTAICGRSIRDILSQIKNAYFFDESYFQLFILDFEKSYQQKKYDSSHFVIDDAVNILSQLLTDKQHLVAIVSGSTGQEIQQDIDRLYQENRIPTSKIAHWGAESYSVGKPSPIPFLTAFNYFSNVFELEIEDCIVIEDSIAGVRAAIAAGMNVIAVNDNEQLHQQFYQLGANKVVCSLRMDHLESLLVDTLYCIE
jgi:beta-phosphoglucomutase-like phosphatase (HAD superfamily)